MARDAAEIASEYLQRTLTQQGNAAVVLATGNSQIQFLEAMVAIGCVNWSRVTLFHMDEYLGLEATHPASFRHYMKERVESRLKPLAFHYLRGDSLEPLSECARYAQLLQAQPIDLCCLGIGENGHLAFNDPPVADFNDPRRVKIVKLDDACRAQQVGEGHFPHVNAVPQYAVTLTIPTLCSAKRMMCIVPEGRKAKAVRSALEGPITPNCPASYLRSQSQATLFLDSSSAGQM